MVLPFFSQLTLILRFAGPEEAKNLAGGGPSPDSDPFNDVEFEKISTASQDNSATTKMARATATAHITLSLPRGAKNRHNPNLAYDIMKTLTGRARHGDVTEASR